MERTYMRIYETYMQDICAYMKPKLAHAIVI